MCMHCMYVCPMKKYRECPEKRQTDSADWHRETDLTPGITNTSGQHVQAKQNIHTQLLQLRDQSHHFISVHYSATYPLGPTSPYLRPFVIWSVALMNNSFPRADIENPSTCNIHGRDNPRDISVKFLSIVWQILIDWHLLIIGRMCKLFNIYQKQHICKNDYHQQFC